MHYVMGTTCIPIVIYSRWPNRNCTCQYDFGAIQNIVKVFSQKCSGSLGN